MFSTKETFYYISLFIAIALKNRTPLRSNEKEFVLGRLSLVSSLALQRSLAGNSLRSKPSKIEVLGMLISQK
jgi:hypothetical protein